MAKRDISARSQMIVEGFVNQCRWLHNPAVLQELQVPHLAMRAPGRDILLLDWCTRGRNNAQDECKARTDAAM